VHFGKVKIRLFYYVSRTVSVLVPEGASYRLPHIYVLSILTEDLFQGEPDSYLSDEEIAECSGLSIEEVVVLRSQAEV